MGEDAAHRDWVELQTLTSVVDVLELDEPGVGIKDANVQVGVVEDLAQFVANRVVDALHVELSCQALLYGVDDGELSRSLLDRSPHSLPLPLPVLASPRV